MKVVFSGDFLVRLDNKRRHNKRGSFAVSFIETNSIKLSSKACHENGNTLFSSECGYSNDAKVDQYGCIEVYFEDYEAMFECYEYSSDDYKKASGLNKERVSAEVRVGICFYMDDQEQSINYVSEQLSFTPSEISFDCAASACEMIVAIKSSYDLKRNLIQCHSYEEVQTCFKKVGLDVCDSESFASRFGLGDQACEEVARYGWGSCIVSTAIYGVFEGYET